MSHSPDPRFNEDSPMQRGLCMLSLLMDCANNIVTDNTVNANKGLEQISRLASPNGDPMQRIIAYFAEALADRMLKSVHGVYQALNATKITSLTEEIFVNKMFYEICPFLRLSYVITNQAILEAMKGEKVIHIIDLHSAEPAQWLSLLQTLSARAEGPPYLKITGIHTHTEVLDQMASILHKEAEKLAIPFQFNPMVSRLEDLDMGNIRVRTGEALAVSSVFQLHRLLACDDLLMHSPAADSPKMTSFLNSLCEYSPKVMVVTEQEANHNRNNLVERIDEAMKFYGAMFDILDSTMPRMSFERQKIEKMIFGEEIKNIVACEGLERTQRHEKLEKWIPRLEMAGFNRMPLSYNSLLHGKDLLQRYSGYGYQAKEKNGCFFISRNDQPLFSVSAWIKKR